MIGLLWHNTIIPIQVPFIMPATAKIDRPTVLHMHLPLSLRVKLDLYLWSELEGRVPKGAYQAFFIERLQEFFGKEKGNE